MGSFGGYFLFYGLEGFHLFIFIALAWRHKFFLFKILSAFSPGNFGSSFNISYHFNYCPANPGSVSLPRVWHKIRPICSQRHLSSKLIFFFPISADGRRCHFRFRVMANHLASFFFSPVTECKHLLAFILTWICYFGCKELTYILFFLQQPTFLIFLSTVNIWQPTNSNTEG